MKKKILGFIFVFFLAITLVACGDGKKPGGGGVNNGNDDGNGDENGGGGGGQTRGEKITIMHGAVHEIDPFHANFSGTDRKKRQDLQREIEEELDVQVIYKEYPAAAPWGPGRVENIIKWHQAGNAEADIYWITTQWLSEISEAQAIKEISNEWLSEYGSKVDSSFLDASTIGGKVFGFGPEKLFGDLGLFYNTALITEWGLEDPVDLWNNGEWTWDKFEELAIKAKTGANAAEGQAVLGGMPSVYAESLLPLNGSSIVSLDGGVTFNTPDAYAVYDFLEKLSDAGMFEANPTYDSGSEAWQAGDVLFHPGSLWFVKATNRWGNAEFVKEGNIGVVPYPMPTGKFDKEKYKTPLGGEAIYTVATNAKDPAKEELAFEVWNKLQLWKTDEELETAFGLTLANIFAEQKHADVYLEVYDKVYFDIHADLGISTYNVSSWQSNINTAIREGGQSYRAKMESIEESYKNAYNKYKGE